MDTEDIILSIFPISIEIPSFVLLSQGIRPTVFFHWGSIDIWFLRAIHCPWRTFSDGDDSQTFNFCDTFWIRVETWPVCRFLSFLAYFRSEWKERSSPGIVNSNICLNDLWKPGTNCISGRRFQPQSLPFTKLTILKLKNIIGYGDLITHNKNTQNPSPITCYTRCLGDWYKLCWTVILIYISQE